ncbi:hypothetical protein [Streptomyces sp. NPDC002215]|uniref:hypothetical protein n=1 Tax=Streptomyces sp. NPDC002215 TaxID=3154412 RepID=UPI00332FBAE5
MWFAELVHPYDDPDDPGQWAWRFGCYEAIYTTITRTLTLSRGPKYSTRGVEYCCTLCHGYGTLFNSRDASGSPRKCPTCPTRRVLLKRVPLWPVHTLDRLHTWRIRRRHTPAPPTNPWVTPGPNPDSHNEEPPF